MDDITPNITPDSNSSTHVVPVSDQIEHTLDDACVCGPRIEGGVPR